MELTREVITAPDSPTAIGPYSQAIRIGQVIYTSGQIPLDPETGQIVSPDIENQIDQVFKNLEAVLISAQSDLSHLVKINCYMTDLSSFSIVNKAFEKFLNEPYPARACVEVSALPKNSLVEIDAVALVKQ